MLLKVYVTSEDLPWLSEDREEAGVTLSIPACDGDEGGVGGNSCLSDTTRGWEDVTGTLGLGMGEVLGVVPS